MAAGTIATSSEDRRVSGRQNPVARIQTVQKTWATSAGHAAQTDTVFISGTIYRMDVVILAVTANPTVAITCADDNGGVFGNELDHAALADGSTHYFDSQSSKDDDADFNPVTHHGDIVVTIDPSADAGGGTLAVDVIFYVR